MRSKFYLTLGIAVFGLCGPIAAAIKIDRVESTSRQILVRYTVPEEQAAQPCAWSASRLDNSAQSVNDVDTRLFPGANQDGRNPQLGQGPHRIFVLGRPRSERATDKYVYSRALKAATKYRLEVRCGTETASVEAETKTVPFGKTRGESLPADPEYPGDYLHPSRKWNVAGQKIIDPQTGVELTFPLSADLDSTPPVATFKEAAGGSGWSTANGALKDKDSAAARFSTAATHAESSSAPTELYMQWDYDRFGSLGGDGTANAYDVGGIDFLQLMLKGSANGESEADRTIQVALTFDGVTAGVPWRDVVLDRSESTKTVGSGKVGDTWQPAGRPPISRSRIAGRSGTFAYDAEAKKATFKTGSTSDSWAPGTRFRVYDRPISGVIEDATNTSPIVIQLPAHGLSADDGIEISGVPGNTNANGTWAVTIIDTDHFALKGSSGNAPYGGDRGAQSQVIDVIPGTPCKILVDLNQTIANNDRIKVTELKGISGVAGRVFTVNLSPGNGGSPAMAANVLTLDDSSCSGRFDNTSMGKGNSDGRVFKVTGTAQRFRNFSIAAIPNGSSVILEKGPEANTAASALAEAVTQDAGTITLRQGGGAPFSAGSDLVIDRERMSVTGTDGDVLTVSRGRVNTAPAVHAAGADVLEVKEWKVEPFGLLVRAKSDGVSVQYAAMKYQLSRGVPWTAAGGPKCGPGLVAGPGGKMGYLCDIGGPRWVAADGTAINDWGNVVNYLDYDVQQGNGCVGNGATSNGWIGKNPNDPKRIYCFPWIPAKNDRYVIVAQYEGDFRKWTPQPANTYYEGYLGSFAGAPVLPNCYGLGKFNDGKNSRLSAFANGTPCVSYKRYTDSLKGLLRNYGRQLWKKQNPDLDKVNCTADSNSLSLIWNEARSKPHVAVKCLGSQDEPSVDYVFEIDDDKETVTPIAEVASFDRDGATWSGVHGGFPITDVVDGYVSTTPYPPGLMDYAVNFKRTGTLQGPYWANYTSVNGIADAAMTNASGEAGLISCDAWADSPYLPKPVPDGSTTKVNGALAGCTTLKLAGELCDDSLNGDQSRVIAADPRVHAEKCGGPDKFWLQDLRPGDMVIIDNGNPSTFYAAYENARVIAKTGSGPGTEVTLYRGGVVPLAGPTYGHAAGAKDYTGVKEKRIIAWMNHPDSGYYQDNFIDYLNHPFDQGGAEWLVGYGHGSRSRAGVVGSDGETYGVLLGDFQKQKTADKPDFRVANMVSFAGKRPNDNNAIDSHVAWIPGAQGDSEVPWLLDGRPWAGYNGMAGVSVPGTTSVYKFPKSVWGRSKLTYLWPKFLPVAARSGTSVLRSISGPNSAIGDNTPYTFCYALRAGECRRDSEAEDFYVAAPFVSVTGGVAQCCGNDVSNVRDIAFTSATSILSCFTQTALVPDESGRSTRCLTTAFDRYRLEDTFKNWSVTPNGATGIGRTRGLEQVKSEIWVADLPPVRMDSVDRSTWVQLPVEIPAYAGADNVVVEFGYEPYANAAEGEYFCIDRREACVVGAGRNDDNPYWFASEDPKGIACQSGCMVSIPTVGDSVVYYRIRYRSGSDVVQTSPQFAMTTP